MKILRSLLMIILVAGLNNIMAIEEPDFKIVKKDGNFELRKYSDHIVAEVVIDDDFEKAGSQAFRMLFKYIDGNNSSSSKISMTAPVSQKPAGEKISMTAPVSQKPSDEGWVISFAMPSKFTMETVPVPNDGNVKIRLVPGDYVASLKYSGFWSKSGFDEKEMELKNWISKNGLTIRGETILARYNSPFTPWFMRRNEVLIPVQVESK